MAIVRDVLERQDLGTMAGTKRTAVIEAPLLSAKRRKATMVLLPADKTKHSEVIAVSLVVFIVFEITEQIDPRMIALVNLRYGPFCSLFLPPLSG